SRLNLFIYISIYSVTTCSVKFSISFFLKNDIVKIMIDINARVVLDRNKIFLKYVVFTRKD
ncbi:hypothetical protein DU012_15455, partial [Listeria monocytogenes]|nr:hypothetical protein [Listeria monocytogenes]MCY32923.1 hypothetical protein [Listeria monocytogenes]